MKTKILFAILAAALLGGCSSVSVKSRKMKITTPLFSYESETEGFTGTKAAPSPAPLSTAITP